ncbi:MAG: hypothetical protein ACW99A_00040 [Candidatus Kariarchaeaceae archaeon]|jgi:RNase P/RNase MRP subunit p30
MNGLVSEFNSNLLKKDKIGDVLKFLKIKHVGLVDNNFENTSLLQDNNIDSFSRITLQENKGVNAQNLKKQLAKYRFRYDFIVVEPKSAGVAAIAARDGRVDAIRINSDSRLKVFNTRYGRRLEDNHKLVEVDVSVFWYSKIAKNLRPITRILRSFKNCKLEFILTKDIKEINDMRSYRGLQSIGRLLELSNQQTHPNHLINLIEKNRKKRQGIIPMKGVEIIEW